MSARLRQIFSVGRRPYTWTDLAVAACLWGEWAALEARVRAGLACRARLDDLGDEEGLDETEVDAAADEFRYARGLVAAADLDEWLEARGLAVDAWLDAIRRGLLLEQWADDLDAIQARYSRAPDEVHAAILPEAFCTGWAADIASRLAGRVAVHSRAVEQAASPEDSAAGEVAALVAAVDPAVLARALPGMPPAEARQRLEAIALLETAWQRFAAAQATPEALTAIVTARRLDWIRVVVRTVAAGDEDVAREVALCGRDDGRDLSEVAAEAGLAASQATWWVEETEAPLRDHLVGARVGDVLGPFRAEEEFTVLAVLAKQVPSADDPEVRARAERELVAAAVDREVANRVTWLMAP